MVRKTCADVFWTLAAQRETEWCVLCLYYVDKPIMSNIGGLSLPDGGLNIRRYLLPKVHRCITLQCIPLRANVMNVSQQISPWHSAVIVR
ncbi:hypothetical protein Xbed_00119 [Xenorhabdus beddingii]|uniref:Uncharacterized protein n=1 Tax=Xenorhabdus beddingii TaxID=40578 RepID=A0A1Y2SU41_9GAMM|nr:hypothetical protein Xbed_00119 [Xenorhabdus beddingii]